MDAARKPGEGKDRGDPAENGGFPSHMPMIQVVGFRERKSLRTTQDVLRQPTSATWILSIYA